MNHSMNSSHSMNTNHYIVMFVIMLFSGLLTTMNIYTDKLSDIRLSLNDLYMTLVMTGWMFLFMGIFYKEVKAFLFGILLIGLNMFAIRTQFMITEKQYLLGMIPHHSMAVHMTKKLIDKGISNTSNTKLKPFLDNIINTQNNEIEFMKQNL
jgi:hypothetical protein